MPTSACSASRARATSSSTSSTARRAWKARRWPRPSGNLSRASARSTACTSSTSSSSIIGCRRSTSRAAARRIAFGTDRNKQLAANFVGGITADGGTDRFAALKAALAFRPDVIFFLTDADDPMSASELAEIDRRVNERGRRSA